MRMECSVRNVCQHYNLHNLFTIRSIVLLVVSMQTKHSWCSLRATHCGLFSCCANVGLEQQTENPPLLWFESAVAWPCFFMFGDWISSVSCHLDFSRVSIHSKTRHRHWNTVWSYCSYDSRSLIWKWLVNDRKKYLYILYWCYV